GPETRTSLIDDVSMPFEQLLRTVLSHFGAVPPPSVVDELADASREDLENTLSAFVGPFAVRRALGVIIVDGADDVPTDTLTNLEQLVDRVGPGVLQLILVGRMDLLARLNRPVSRSLLRRSGLRTRLKALSADEVPAYVRHRLRTAGVQGPGDSRARAAG